MLVLVSDVLLILLFWKVFTVLEFNNMGFFSSSDFRWTLDIFFRKLLSLRKEKFLELLWELYVFFDVLNPFILRLLAEKKFSLLKES